MNDGGAVVHSVYRQRPKVLLAPANPHEYWRIASKFAVRPDFDVTAKLRRKPGVEF